MIVEMGRNTIDLLVRLSLVFYRFLSVTVQKEPWEFVGLNLLLSHKLLWEDDVDWMAMLSLGVPVISSGTYNWSLVYLWYLHGRLMGPFA